MGTLNATPHSLELDCGARKDLVIDTVPSGSIQLEAWAANPDMASIDGQALSHANTNQGKASFEVSCKCGLSGKEPGETTIGISSNDSSEYKGITVNVVCKKSD